jgi:hypothetical protein
MRARKVPGSAEGSLIFPNVGGGGIISRMELVFSRLGACFSILSRKGAHFATDKTMLLSFMDRDIWNLIVSQGHGHFTVFAQKLFTAPKLTESQSQWWTFGKPPRARA